MSLYSLLLNISGGNNKIKQDGKEMSNKSQEVKNTMREHGSRMNSSFL